MTTASEAAVSGGYELHCHTTYSDGTLSPTEIVDAAARIGLEGIAITDHDTLAAWPEAAAAARTHGIELLSGVEITSDVEKGGCHLLAYLFDPEDPILCATLVHLREKRRARAAEIARRLAAEGKPIVLPDVPEPRSIGRPHIAKALVEAGHVASHREAFDRHLVPGTSTYVPTPRLPPSEAIEMVRRAGGVVVLAHPHTFDYEERISAYRDLGLVGIEADYASYDEGRRRKFRAMAARLGLFVTAGSDFHGANRPERKLGEVAMPRTAIEALRRAAETGMKPGAMPRSRDVATESVARKTAPAVGRRS